MGKGRNLIFYIAIIVVFGALMYLITKQGAKLEVGEFSAPVQPQSGSPFDQFTAAFSKNLVHPLSILLLQIVSIIIVSRAFGYIFNKIGQPTVIGEIVAGIVLGPSLLGLFFPEASAFLFAKESLPNLQFLSQVGLILFMYVIGMELDLKVLRNQAHDAVVISHASIVIPYFFGMGLAYYMYQEFAPANISFLSFALFMGIAMSITAFPVLARIIQERDLTKTKLGSIAITCAAADDVTAWCILAAVIAIVKAGTFVSALFTIGAALLYVLVMLFVIQPFLKKVGNIYSNRETISKMIVALSFLVLLISAYVAEIIGIHALFGAFLAGVIMPANMNFRRVLMGKVEDVSLVLLLPLFFVFTGLRTQIGLLNQAHLWGMCGFVVLTAVAGKFGGSAFAARFVGQSWKDSLSIGALMNTRGLMELIVLNIGYDLGILSPEVFSMMVLMALVTTFMTAPALDLINYLFPDKEQAGAASRLYKILILFGPSAKGRKLLRLADQLTHKNHAEASITTMHLTPSADINPNEAGTYEEESFRLVKQEADNLNIRIKTIYRATNDIGKEVTRETKKGRYDLLLVGSSRSVFSDDVVGGKVKTFLEETRGHVGVLVDKDFEVADRILVFIHNPADLFLLSFAERFVQNNNAKITLVDSTQLAKNDPAFKPAVEKLGTPESPAASLPENELLQADMLAGFNLVIISYNAWGDSDEEHQLLLAQSASVLILKAPHS
ncbi:MAG TPA: cation:proton antiporter [Cyclobacteriaceae bacterium]|nr:cation:proton antiporter [Cyclobacteriaceae bacterium]HMV10129.1 cation:proton antiporter [Cyclobacteriaceae bacterium]HMV90353.1 cation:proton antiporter [Cyclobacteriaceae bacterium]HMX00556.1 cation:proton antiporter [Cyclobacteriaceae bacterium]HMX49569.1 cation:proton antiporter [Cyclobacteriaceae bacterium]